VLLRKETAYLNLAVAPKFLKYRHESIAPNKLKKQIEISSVEQHDLQHGAMQRQQDRELSPSAQISQTDSQTFTNRNQVQTLAGRCVGAYFQLKLE
jgi:hypothetical protein